MRYALKEPFPCSPYSPATRHLDNLWTGRRFRLYGGPGEFREGEGRFVFAVEHWAIFSHYQLEFGDLNGLVRTWGYH